MSEESAISAEVGKPFDVVVDSLPSAGFQWQVEVDPAVIELQERKREPSLAVGGSLRERFVFVPHQRGEFVIRMRYGRPWEAQAQKSRALRVRVT